jgi:hypothetical protein
MFFLKNHWIWTFIYPFGVNVVCIYLEVNRQKLGRHLKIQLCFANIAQDFTLGVLRTTKSVIARFSILFVADYKCLIE